MVVVATACGAQKPRGPMTDGERTYLSKCTSCHRIYEPSEHSPKEWVAEIAEMERLKRVRLEPAERAQILTYLTGSPDGQAGAASR